MQHFEGRALATQVYRVKQGGRKTRGRYEKMPSDELPPMSKPTVVSVTSVSPACLLQSTTLSTPALRRERPRASPPRARAISPSTNAAAPPTTPLPVPGPPSAMAKTSAPLTTASRPATKATTAPSRPEPKRLAGRVRGSPPRSNPDRSNTQIVEGPKRRGGSATTWIARWVGNTKSTRQRKRVPPLAPHAQAPRTRRLQPVRRE